MILDDILKILKEKSSDKAILINNYINLYVIYIIFY